MCAISHGSRIHGGSGIGVGRLVSVEKLQGTDPGRGEIGAALWHCFFFEEISKIDKNVDPLDRKFPRIHSVSFLSMIFFENT